MDREQPLVDRDMAALHDGAGAASELVAAIVAEEITGLGLASHAVHVDGATMRAIDAIGPTGGLQMGNSGLFVGELAGGVSGHG